MAKFTEEAVLKLIDEASSPAKKINRELNALLKTTKKFKPIDFEIKGVSKAQRQLRAFISELDKVTEKKRSIQLLVPTVPKGKIASINELTKAINGYARAVNSVQGVKLPNIPKTPVTRPSIGAGRGGGGIPTSPAMFNGGGGMVNINSRPLASLLDGFVYRLGATIENSIISGFQKGLQTRDVADTRLNLQQLPPDDRKRADRAIDEAFRNQGGNAPVLSRGQVSQVFTEALPSTRGDVEGNARLTKELLSMIRLQIAQGADADSAIDAANRFAKAGEQSGNFNNPQTGNFDPARAAGFFDVLKKVAPDIGAEFTAAFVQQATKYLRTTKFTLGPEAFATTLFMNEESGTSASVGINQMIKTLTGERVGKKQLANLISMGIISEGQVKTGDVGGQSITEIVGKGTTDEEGFRTNFLDWINNQVLPVMRGKGMDPNNPVDAAKFAGSITSDRTATEALATTILRMQELQAQVKRALERDVSGAAQDDALAGSSTLAAVSAKNQIIGLAGEIANSFEAVLIPAMQGVASISQSLQSFIAGPEGQGSMLRSGAVAAGVAGGGYLAAKGGGALMSFFNPLTKSALALDGSAAALLRAAVALGGSGVASGIPDVSGASGKRRGSVPSVNGSLSGKGGGGAAGLAAGIPILAGMIGDITDWAGFIASDKPTQEKLIADNIAEARETNQSIMGFLKGLVGANDDPRKAPLNEMVNPSSNPGEAASLRQEINALTEQMAQARQNEKLPGTADLQITQLESKRDYLAQQLAAMETSSTSISTAFTNGSLQLDGSASLFEQAFAIGNQGIISGSQAIQSAGLSIGPTIQNAIVAGGQQVAASIQSAMSNPVKVTVNTPGPKADTGSSIPN